MTKNAVSVLLFEGGYPACETEKMLADIRQMILLDNLAKIREAASVGSIYLLTNRAHLAEKALARGCIVLERGSLTGDDFHFGRALRELINQEKLEHVFYMGGAGFPFLRAGDLEEAASALLAGSKPVIYANNAVSADIVAFAPGSLINQITPPGADNSLALFLRTETRVEHRLFKPCTGFLFDLDTPTDLLILAGSPFTGPKVREAIERLDLDLSRLQRAKEVIRNDNYDDILLLGRVGAPVMAKINQSWKVRLRVFSEERGMKALGRDKRGEVVSLLGYFLQEVGPKKFIQYLEKICSAAFLDTRVLMAHLKPDLPAEERYLSDLGRWQEMKEPFFREFTRCAVESDIPIILGGHSLVLGGLWALLDELECSR